MYIEGSHNFYIVALSLLVAALASYSALSIVLKLSDSKGKTKYLWLLAGAIVMGSGIWSMHFIGMLAFRLPIPMEYNIRLTIISMIASMLSSFISFYITMSHKVNTYKIAAGGFFMGIGISAMHYIGMAAMIMPVEVSYDTTELALSVVIAFFASYVALILFIRFKNRTTSNNLLKWLAALIMGAAISGMHYMGMKAASYYAEESVIEDALPVNDYLLYGVTVMIFFILIVSWSAIFFDRHRRLLEEMAFFDTLTGLPNRNSMNHFFEHDRSKGNIGILFIDLDQFKVINDTLGHDMGDLLVKEVATRLRQFAGGNIKTYRIGGDEFLFIIKQGEQSQAVDLAEQILQEINKVYVIEGNELYITSSIGISIGSVMDSNATYLLKQADTALYKAKDLGKNQYYMHNDEMGRKEIRKMELEKDIKLALENDQFHLVYQPKWNVKQERLSGFEALLRWEHPSLGWISPNEFIPIAEETGSIIPITHWVMEKACLQCRSWHVRGHSYPVSVNVSVRLFKLNGLSKTVQSALEKIGLPPHLLELEITESMILHNIDEVIYQLENLRNLGVKVSLDDFGTGYSSIGLLDQLPIDTIKLDWLFTRDIETPAKYAIVKAIIIMAESLKLDVIAEGVEDQLQVDVLKGLGCYIMQGYFYSKPLEVRDMDKWLID